MSAVITVVLLALLALDARGAGWAEVRRVLWRERSAILLGNTVLLATLVIAFALVLGVGAAWCTERTRLPGQRVWTVLLVIPVAIPDFVVGYAWHSFAPRMDGLLAATLVMTLGTYPLVYLPVAAALRRADPGMEEAARSLGTGAAGVLLRVTVPLIRVAALGGAVLVALTVIAEYGAFEILRYQTFTTEIFTEFRFDPDSAGALSIPLVLLGLVVLGTDAVIPRRAAPRVRRRPPAPANRGSLPTVLVLGAVVLLGVGVPIGTLGYWMTRSEHSTLPAAATLSQATYSTLGYSACGAAISVLLAMPVAMMGFRGAGRARVLLERGTYVTQALPGVVIALSLVFLATRYAFALYQSSVLLVAAYAILHFPLALVCVKTSMAQAPAQLADVARSLGRGPVGLTGLGKRFPHQLSGGQQQRVALARALAVHPSVVLLDEPFSSLDAALRASLRRDVAHVLAETATTTILVTHDQQEALTLADRVAVLRDGRMVACADPRTLYRSPPDPAMATFLGEANIMPAIIHASMAHCILGTIRVDHAEDGPCKLLVRPEQLLLHTSALEGRTSASIGNRQFHGHDTLVTLLLNAPQRSEVVARVPGDLTIHTGQPVWIEVRGPIHTWPD